MSLRRALHLMVASVIPIAMVTRSGAQDSMNETSLTNSEKSIVTIAAFTATARSTGSSPL